MHANGTKPAAALTSGLLARRGGARPAMRRATVQPAGSDPLDDLGWNDLGDTARHSGHAPSPAATQPQPSPVARQIAAIRAELMPFVKPAPAPVPTSRPAQMEAERTAPIEVSHPAGSATQMASGRKCAFTLRIDADRHLRLRLLSAVSNVSAQRLLTEALDTLLARHPHIEELASGPDAHQRTTGPRKRTSS